MLTLPRGTPSRSSGRKRRWAQHLAGLATKPGEKGGLCGGEHAEAAGAAVEEASDVVAQQPPAGELEERDQQSGQFVGRIAVARRTRQLSSHGGGGLWPLRRRCGVGSRDWEVQWGRWTLRGGGLPYPMPSRIDEGEELAGRGREGVVVEDWRVVDRGHEVGHQVVDDLNLTRGAVLAGEAAEQRLDEVVDEAGENARGLRGIEVGDFVAPAFAADLFERRLEPAGDELFVEAWGANKPIMNFEL